MSKELHCRDVGPDPNCDGVVVAEREDDVLAQVAGHAKAAHGMTDEQINDPDFQARVRDSIRDKAP